MLEIGCNVVVLSLDQYEELKKAQRTLEALKEAVYYEKSYWSDNEPALLLEPKVIKDIIISAWNKYVGPQKEDYALYMDYGWDRIVINNFLRPVPKNEAEVDNGIF